MLGYLLVGSGVLVCGILWEGMGLNMRESRFHWRDVCHEGAVEPRVVRLAWPRLVCRCFTLGAARR